MQMKSNATPPAAPQIGVRTNLSAGSCQSDTNYWRNQFNKINREVESRGCLLR